MKNEEIPCIFTVFQGILGRLVSSRLRPPPTMKKALHNLCGAFAYMAEADSIPTPLSTLVFSTSLPIIKA